MSNTKRRLRASRRLAIPLAIAAVVLSGCASSVTSITSQTADGGYQPIPTPAPEEPVTIRENFQASPEDTHEFWSDPEMFTNVQTFQYAAPDENVTMGGGDSATGAYIAPTDNAPLADPGNGFAPSTEPIQFDGTGLAGQATGRLYMEFTDHNSVCSATVVNSDTGNVVVTASHCIKDLKGDGSLAKSVVFVPGDRNDGEVQPYGVWAATEYLMSDKFGSATEGSNGADGAGWAYDFTFLVMEEKDGQSIQDAVGGAMGIAFGVPVNQISAMGYPAEEPFDGTIPWVCTTNNWAIGTQGGYTYPCYFIGGSSGGGDFAYYNTETGSGYLVAVNSLATRQEPYQVWNCVLGQTAMDLYQRAGGFQVG